MSDDEKTTTTTTTTTVDDDDDQEYEDEQEQDLKNTEISPEDEKLILDVPIYLQTKENPGKISFSKLLYMFHNKWVQLVEHDILDQAGARDLVIMDGDALLEHILSSPYVDFAHGGAFLHLTFLLEMFVRNMKERTVRLEVVFFDMPPLHVQFSATKDQRESQEASVDVQAKQRTEPYRIARSLTIQHLTLLGIKCRSYANWFNDAVWLEDFRKLRPSLILGSKNNALQLMYFTLVHEVIYGIDLEFRGNSVYAMTSDFFFRNLTEQTTQGVESLIAHYLKDVPVAAAPATLVQPAQAKQAYEKLLAQEQHAKVLNAFGGRIAASVQALSSSLLCSASTDLDLNLQFAQIVAASLLLQTVLPLSLRAQVLNVEIPALSKFLNLYLDHLEAVISQDKNIVLFDIFDGRLAFKVAELYYQQVKTSGKCSALVSLDLPQEIAATYKAIQQTLLDSIGSKATETTTIDKQTLLSQVKEVANTNLSVKAMPEENKLIPIKNELVDSFFGDWQENYFEDEKLKQFVQQGESFANEFKWKYAKNADESVSFEPTRWWQKRALENTQKRLAKYGMSLGGINDKKTIQQESGQGEDDRNINSVKQRLQTFGNTVKSALQKAISKLQILMEKEPRKALLKTEPVIAERLQAFNDLINEVKGYLRQTHDMIERYDSLNIVNVMHLNAKTEKKHLEEVFSKYGSIISINLDSVKKSATIYFDSLEQAKQAAAAVNQMELCGSKIQTTMKKMLEPEDFHDINVHMFTSYHFLIDVLLEQLKLLQLRSNNEDVSDEKYWLVFEHVCLVYDLAQGVEQLYEKTIAAATAVEEDDKKAKKKKEKDDKKKKPVKKGVAPKKEEEKQDIPKLKPKKILQTLIEALLNCGFVAHAKSILESHPKLGELGDLDDIEEVRDNVTLQFLYNSVYKSADEFLPSFLNQKKSRDKNFLQSLGFKPDPWQEELMQHVDNKHSVLCTAPTSSGKTFIAFYVVERVLRESEDGTVVFVFPTKPLVNQAYAEVFSKFKKEYKNDNQKLLGLYNGQDKINVLNSQVLITLPTYFESLLVDPHNTEWKKKLKFVVLDEIHCINSAEEGAVWEHVLLMLNCPFVALSATVGNAADFTSWLNKNKQNVHLVQHTERPRPLEYTVFVPPKLPAKSNDPKEKIDYTAKYPTQGAFAEVHPCAVLNPFRVEVHEIQSMPSMSPKQLLDLYYAAASFKPNVLKDLNPKTFAEFQGVGIISRRAIHEYALKVRDRLVSLAEDAKNHPALLALFKKLRDPVDSAFNTIYQRFNTKRIDDAEFILSNFVGLIDSMHTQRLLPTLAFIMDRNYIPRLVKRLLEFVKQTNKNLWYTDLERNKSLNEIRITVSELLESKDSDVDDYIIDALELGIAVHYTGMDESYQKEVERLYRGKHIPVMICTGTLALGVHMPCKSVCMLGYSQYLHSQSTFVQCSGRAGRRGFDIKGTVILYGMPQMNMDRLMTAPPTKLMGSTGLTPTFILQVMRLYNLGTSLNPKDKYVLEEAKRLFMQPPFYMGDVNINTLPQLPHHFRYNLEFLLRQGLLDATGKPTDFSGFVTNISREPANFITSKFIQSGLLHKIVIDDEEKGVSRDITYEKLLMIFSHLYVLRRVPKENIFARQLPPLDSAFYQLYVQYETDVLEVYRSYVHSYAKMHGDKVVDLKLPTSNNESFVGIAKPSASGIVNALDAQKIAIGSTSTFAALSGNGDQYQSVQELQANLKHTIYLDVLPVLDMNSPASSVIVDFFKHGTWKRASIENQFFSINILKRVLERMSKELKNVVRSIGYTLDFDPTDPLYVALKDLQAKFYERVVGYQFLQKKDNRYGRLRVERDDMELYGPAATREDKRKGVENSVEYKSWKVDTQNIRKAEERARDAKKKGSN